MSSSKQDAAAAVARRHGEEFKRDAVLQEIAICKLDGFADTEIAKRLNIATRTVERKLARIRGTWEQNCESPKGH